MIEPQADGQLKDITPPRCAVAHVWLTNEVYAALVAEAERRRTHPDRLCATIIEQIICLDAVDQVLEL